MTGYMMALGPCYGCGRLFEFNPERVPSIRSPATGAKEPICRECVDHANPQRVQNGLAPIVPLPGAYEPEEVS
jgi:hypothetical protein